MTPQAMTSISGYIIQEDLFIGTLTVKEHLTFLVSIEWPKEMKCLLIMKFIIYVHVQNALV